MEGGPTPAANQNASMCLPPVRSPETPFFDSVVTLSDAFQSWNDCDPMSFFSENMKCFLRVLPAHQYAGDVEKLNGR